MSAAHELAVLRRALPTRFLSETAHEFVVRKVGVGHNPQLSLCSECELP
jgi:hypothetical protein